MDDGPAQLSIEDVRHVAKLARLAVPEDRLGPMREELVAILGHIAQLQAVDTKGLEPMAHPLPMTNRLRADESRPGLSLSDALRNAPARHGDFIAVPKVLGGESS
ncbi:MAG: Asp-tRNA(Asn)/Glu-tRNA(Gln) amidotransferase subunit GatC [Phycisphaerales bacterium]|nr:Asp-tRNA(Asn)/Glu-tRNA(Gln) amidotransferase subunit GatC [Phycisphaerales bacterium]